MFVKYSTLKSIIFRFSSCCSSLVYGAFKLLFLSLLLAYFKAYVSIASGRILYKMVTSIYIFNVCNSYVCVDWIIISDYSIRIFLYAMNTKYKRLLGIRTGDVLSHVSHHEKQEFSKLPRSQPRKTAWLGYLFSNEKKDIAQFKIVILISANFCFRQSSSSRVAPVPQC